MDKKLFFYELEGRGYTFQNKNWDEAKHGFEDDMLNMAWEMWSSGKAAEVQVPEASTSIAVHQRIIDEVKTEINEGYDLCQDSYLLDVLVERGMEIGKIQTIPEGFVLVPMVPSERMVDAVRKCYEGEAYLPYSLYSEFINQAMIEAQEQSHDS